jgi:hypothetical protein
MGRLGASDILLADADVLIDFVKTQPTTLRLVSRHLGQLVVLSEVLDTVDGLTKTDCASLGIKVFTAPTEMLLDAGAKRGRLSFEDHLGFVACRTNRWTMVTNDGALIRVCKEASVQVRRGLRLVLDLVVAGHLSKRAAKQLATAIHVVNPRHIGAAVLRQFEEELGKL